MTKSVARSNECPKMSIREQLDFVKDPLHSGAVTKTLHYVALLPLIWGAASGNLWLFVIGLVLPTLGHAYDKLYRFDAHTQALARQVVWLQLLGTVVVLVPLLIVYLAFQTDTFG